MNEYSIGIKVIVMSLYRNSSGECIEIKKVKSFILYNGYRVKIWK